MLDRAMGQLPAHNRRESHPARTSRRVNSGRRATHKRGGGVGPAQVRRTRGFDCHRPGLQAPARGIARAQAAGGRPAPPVPGGPPCWSRRIQGFVGSGQCCWFTLSLSGSSRPAQTLRAAGGLAVPHGML